MENMCHVLSRMHVYWFATGHGADHIEDTPPIVVMQTGVYCVLHSNEQSMDPQHTLLLLLCVCWNVFTDPLPSKGVYMSQYYHITIYNYLLPTRKQF
jgi:hypothetical protein